MSAAGLLLRMVLMLSLLLNGLNAALAGPMALAMAAPVPAAPAASPCHGDAPAPVPHGHHAAPAPDLASTPDSDHCKIKDCLRSCAQQPSLTVAIAWLAAAPPLWRAPQAPALPAEPTPPQERITRPPIA